MKTSLLRQLNNAALLLVAGTAILGATFCYSLGPDEMDVVKHYLRSISFVLGDTMLARGLHLHFDSFAVRHKRWFIFIGTIVLFVASFGKMSFWSWGGINNPTNDLIFEVLANLGAILILIDLSASYFDKRPVR